MYSNPGKKGGLKLLLIMVVLGFMLGCESETLVPAETNTVAENAASTEDASIQVFFTDPESLASKGINDGLDIWLANQIDMAQKSVEVAIYNLTLESLTDALIRAKTRGVEVGVVMESTAQDSEQPGRLEAAGIEVIGDRRESLMHNKFLIIDNALVCTSSFNYTTTGVYSDNNNLICFYSDKVVQDYQVEFEEMFESDVFGSNLVDTPYPYVDLDGSIVEVYFSPDDGVSQRIVELISQARQSISFLGYSFTSDSIGEALRTRTAEGVDVRGVLDESRALEETGAEYPRFVEAGMEVRLDGNEGLMHHKIIILDGEIVVTGSYNFTRSAEEKNDENCIIIHDAEVARLFEAEFEYVYTLAH